MYRLKIIVVMLTLATHTRSDNNITPGGAEEACAALLWEAAIEEWALAARGNSTRHGRIMSLPATQGYYVSDRIGLVPPPPPGPPLRRGPYPAAPQGHHNAAPQGPHPYDEWQPTPPPPPGAGKIVNRPPNPYKDQFKPSFAPPSPSIPVQSVSDRVDAAAPSPQKQVSETDVYLLRAIEKLVYRVDLMEKRLRKMEENLLYVVAGAEAKPEPCPGNFTRIGGGCYHISTDVANWKGASFACRKLKANLLELGDDEKKQFVHGLLADNRFKGSDYWTGGLNPGLLWIWAHSAKPVANNTSTDIAGDGRCLALLHSPPSDYVYKGQDCALRHRYVCERDEDAEKLGNEIERVARKIREGRRKPKILWTDDDER